MIALKSVSYKSLRRGDTLPIGRLPKMGVFSHPIFGKSKMCFCHHVSSEVSERVKPDYVFLSSRVVGNFGIYKNLTLCFCRHLSSEISECLKFNSVLFVCGVNTKTYVNVLQNPKYYEKG